ncbi:unnamed protein product, partial [Pleuronectes platessa]
FRHEPEVFPQCYAVLKVIREEGPDDASMQWPPLDPRTRLPSSHGAALPPPGDDYPLAVSREEKPPTSDAVSVYRMRTLHVRAHPEHHGGAERRANGEDCSPRCGHVPRRAFRPFSK